MRYKEKFFGANLQRQKKKNANSKKQMPIIVWNSNLIVWFSIILICYSNKIQIMLYDDIIYFMHL